MLFGSVTGRAGVGISASAEPAGSNSSNADRYFMHSPHSTLKPLNLQAMARLAIGGFDHHIAEAALTGCGASR